MGVSESVSELVTSIANMIGLGSDKKKEKKKVKINLTLNLFKHLIFLTFVFIHSNYPPLGKRLLEWLSFEDNCCVYIIIIAHNS